MDTTLLGQALAYKRWADRCTVDAVRALDPAEAPGTLTFARQQLNHLVRVEENFRARLMDVAGAHRPADTCTACIHAAEPQRRDG